MKKLSTVLLSALSFLTGTETIAQGGWINHYYGDEHVEVGKMSVDPDDHVLAVGNFSEDVNIHGTLYTGGGGFLVKLTSTGDLVWHKKFTYSDPVSFSYLTDVETDAEGNVYISGQYPEWITIDAVTLAGMPYSHNSFLAKFNGDGQLQWTKTFKDTQNVFDVAVNRRGDVAVYARHYGALTVDDVTISSNGNAIGVMFSTEGQLQWARSFQTGSGHSTWPIAITLDESGNAYLNGKFSGTLQIDAKQITGSGNYDLFFAKLNAEGVCQWLIATPRKIPAVYETANPPNGLVVEFGDLVTDGTGSLFATGTYWTEMKIESTVLPGSPSGSTAVNFFLLKLDPAGYLEWARHTPDSEQANTSCFIVNRHEKLYVSGVKGSAPYFTVYDLEGTRLTDPVLLPLEGDIGGGFGVDSQDSVYVSGRRRVNWYDVPFRGFVLKYGEEVDDNVVEPVPPPPLGQPGTVQGPEAMCVNAAVRFETSAISQATSYEWELTHNGITTNHTSAEPVLVVPLNTIQTSGELKVRVRGRNASEAGVFSNFYSVSVESPYELLLTSDCREIQVSKGGMVEWYRNGELITDLPRGQMMLTPDRSGNYFITESNGCGIQKSNVIQFTLPESDAYFIPNVITPDGDPFNEFFVLDEKLDSSYVSILNRWGSEVYSSSDYANNWNGYLLPAGVYYYVIENTCLKNALKGTLTISR